MGNTCNKVKESETTEAQEIAAKPTCLPTVCDPCFNKERIESGHYIQELNPIQFSETDENEQSYSESDHENEMETERNFIKTINICHDKNKIETKSEERESDEVSTNKDVQEQCEIVIRAKDTSILVQNKQAQIKKLDKMEIPFEVIKLSMDNNLLSGLKLNYPTFFSEFGNVNSTRYYNWRMQPSGTYSNILDEIHGIFISHNQFYEGFFVKDEEKYIPHEKGLLINKQFIYNGGFERGKPSGKGKLSCRSTGEVYDGTWFEGSFIMGEYHKENIRYDGEFYNGEPSGIGKLRIGENISYTGRFVSGLFEDQNGQYNCQSHIYEGGFKEGKKNGFGLLLVKANKTKIEGQWYYDRINNPAMTYNTE